MCQVWFHVLSVKSDQGSQRRPKKIAVYVNFSIPPSLVITQVKKSLKITFSSISPYSQHFIFSLLPTFSPRFLPPPYFFRPFLPPPYCVPPPSIVDLISVRSSIHQQQSPRLRFRRKYPYWHINYAVNIHPQHRPSRVSKHKLSLW